MGYQSLKPERPVYRQGNQWARVRITVRVRRRTSDYRCVREESRDISQSEREDEEDDEEEEIIVKKKRKSKGKSRR